MSETFAVDGLTPGEVVQPESAAETADLLTEARVHGSAVIPVGGRTWAHVGNAPRAYDLALSTARLSGIVEYSPGDLTVVVRAGTSIAELQHELAKHNQFVPLQPPFPERSTVGGAVAVAGTWPWRAAFGSARDFTIGMRMALPSGVVAKSGGKVVKNVAGYDLSKLFIGSHGSLGVVTEAAFKVYPRPECRLILRLSVPGSEVPPNLTTLLSALGPGLLGVALRGQSQEDEATNSLLISLGGSVSRVRGLRETVEGLARTAGAVVEECNEEMAEVVQNFPADADCRVTCLPTHLLGHLTSLSAGEYIAYPTIGTAYLRSTDVAADRVRVARERLAISDGQLTLLRVSPETKRETDVWGPIGAELSLMRRVKAIFDPERVMSPGRFVGGL